MGTSDVTGRNTDFDSSVLIRLLDNQIVDADGRFLGKADDLVVREEGDDLVVEALMVGPTALEPRYPGVLGRWGWAIWRRLSDPENPGAVLVPLEEVTDLGSAIRVTDGARDALLVSFGLETWLRKHLIERIPGARGAGHQTSEDADVPGWAGPERRPLPEQRGSGPRHRLSELLSLEVLDHEGGSLGRVSDVEGRSGGGDALGPIRVTRVLVGPRRLGSGLGYSTSDLSAPFVIDRLVRAVHRSARWHDWSEVTVSWSEGTAHLREGGRARLGDGSPGSDG